MQLPNHQDALIADDKIRDYLLSDSHPVGRYKAAFFRALGYGPADWGGLAADIRNLLIFDAEHLGTSEFGDKYAVRGAIHGPSGRVEDIVTIWIILTDEDTPRFVTAYPA